MISSKIYMKLAVLFLFCNCAAQAQLIPDKNGLIEQSLYCYKSKNGMFVNSLFDTNNEINLNVFCDLGEDDALKYILIKNGQSAGRCVVFKEGRVFAEGEIRDSGFDGEWGIWESPRPPVETMIPSNYVGIPSVDQYSVILNEDSNKYELKSKSENLGLGIEKIEYRHLDNSICTEIEMDPGSKDLIKMTIYPEYDGEDERVGYVLSWKKFGDDAGYKLNYVGRIDKAGNWNGFFEIGKYHEPFHEYIARWYKDGASTRELAFYNDGSLSIIEIYNGRKSKSYAFPKGQIYIDDPTTIPQELMLDLKKKGLPSSWSF